MGTESLIHFETQVSEIKRRLELKKKSLLQTQGAYQAEAKFEPRKDVPDLANEEVKFNVASSLIGLENKQIKEIDAALARLAKGSYGLCETCGEAIKANRLKAIPEARMCIICSREQEDYKRSSNTSQNIGRT